MYLNSPESLSLRLQHGVTTLENLVVEREVFDTFCNVIHCILNVYVEVQCECVYVGVIHVHHCQLQKLTFVKGFMLYLFVPFQVAPSYNTFVDVLA